jgi:4-amino-4-deoxy-L-arabinose transferase-like glycosyltransferase
VGFEDGYDLIANNLDTGAGYRFDADMSKTMMREPGYPLFLAGVFKIGGYHIEAARVANLLLVIGIAFMMLRLTRRVVDDGKTPAIATALFLLLPGTIISEARGGVEIIFIFVLMAFMLLLYDAVEKGDVWRYLIAGIALGVVVQVRSTPLFFPAFLLVYLLIAVRNSSERLKPVLNVSVLVLGMAIVMLPWVIRNYALVHQLVPTASVQGVAAQEGQYTCEHLSFGNDFYAVQRGAGRERSELAKELGLRYEGIYYYQVFYDARDEVAFNKALLQRTETAYREDPALLGKCVAKNLVNFWFLGKTWQATEMSALMQIPLLGLAANGIWLLFKRRQLSKMGIMLMFAAYIVAVHVPIIAHSRHSVPISPFLAILAGVSLLSIWEKFELPMPREEYAVSS